jgi:hypothetical protein
MKPKPKPSAKAIAAIMTMRRYGKRRGFSSPGNSMLRFIGFVNEFMDEGDARRDSVSCFRGIADTQVLSTLLATWCRGRCGWSRAVHGRNRMWGRRRDRTRREPNLNRVPPQSSPPDSGCGSKRSADAILDAEATRPAACAASSSSSGIPPFFCGLICGTRGAASRLASQIIPHTEVCGTSGEIARCDLVCLAAVAGCCCRFCGEQRAPHVGGSAEAPDPLGTALNTLIGSLQQRSGIWGIVAATKEANFFLCVAHLAITSFQHSPQT